MQEKNAYKVVKESEHPNRIVSTKNLLTQFSPRKKVEKIIGSENIY
jgi:hypothetical protein